MAHEATVEAEPLKQLWANVFMAQVETKSGAITLVDGKVKKRPKKRRKLNDDIDDDEELPRNQDDINDNNGDDIQMGIDYMGDDGWGGPGAAGPWPRVLLMMLQARLVKKPKSTA